MGEKGVYRHDHWRGRGLNDPFARLYCVTDGSGFVRHHGREFHLRPGHAYLIPPYANLDLGTPDAVTIWWVHAEVTLAGVAGVFSVLPPEFEIGPPSGLAAARILDRLLVARAQSGVGSELAAKGLFLELLGLFYPPGREAEAPVGRRDEWRRFQAVFELVRRQFSRRLSVAELAAAAGLERSYFSVRFRALCGLSPAQYVTRCRVERARVLLQDTGVKLEAVARETGFHDAFHFSRTFKRLTGRFPSASRGAPPPVLP